MGYSYQIRTTSALPVHNHYLIANNKIPIKSVTFKSSPIPLSIFCKNFDLKLISATFEELLVNLKPLTTLYVSLNLKVQHITRIHHNSILANHWGWATLRMMHSI
jgi:hypothetical protein